MLKDLTPEGFVMAKSKIMDYPHLRLALRCLGELHACSFIIRYADPTSFEKLKRIDEPVFSREPLFSEQPTNSHTISVQKGLIDIVLKVCIYFVVP